MPIKLIILFLINVYESFQCVLKISLTFLKVINGTTLKKKVVFNTYVNYEKHYNENFLSCLTG